MGVGALPSVARALDPLVRSLAVLLHAEPAVYVGAVGAVAAIAVAAGLFSNRRTAGNIARQNRRIR